MLDPLLIICMEQNMTKVSDVKQIKETGGTLIVAYSNLPTLIKQLIRARIAIMFNFKNVVY
jgi:hypothetical protein